MKNQELIKKIEEIAKTFKSRTNVGQSDGKRHDIIQRDEQKAMWEAHYKIGWSYPKIGSVFDRGVVTVEKQVEELQKSITKLKEQRQQKEQLVRSQQQIEHVTKLRELAISIREDVQRLVEMETDYSLDAEYLTLIPFTFVLVDYPYLIWLFDYLKDKAEKIEKLASYYFDSEYSSLLGIAHKLFIHPNWIWLSGHLGDKAKEIELLADGCGENIIKVSIVENEKRINDAKQLLTDSLYPIAFYGDTKEWKAWGLKATCPCPCCSDNI
jgi:transposase